MDVAISDLRANLKAYVERAKAGERIVVTDRGVPVARLVQRGAVDRDAGAVEIGEPVEPAMPRLAVAEGRPALHHLALQGGRLEPLVTPSGDRREPHVTDQRDPVLSALLDHEGPA